MNYFSNIYFYPLNNVRVICWKTLCSWTQKQLYWKVILIIYDVDTILLLSYWVQIFGQLNNPNGFQITKLHVNSFCSLGNHRKAFSYLFIKQIYFRIFDLRISNVFNLMNFTLNILLKWYTYIVISNFQKVNIVLHILYDL